MANFPSYKPSLVTEAVVAPIANGEVLVATADNRKALVLNETAAVVVSLCNGECSLQEIAAIFVETQDIEIEQAQSDVLALLHKLDCEGLLQEPPPANT